ncbi:MAG: hypothetical protein C0631_04685 [Sedimenticola sp.]|nr:MAG: hypothetical protein C0631_04685 [Sedimenticola sp.]
MKLTRILSKASAISLFVLAALATHAPAIAGKNHGGSGSDGSATALDPRFDTSFAIEYDHSCLSGGCHETDSQLVEEHAESFMTHTMVKCNACHGTHTADTLGEEKPNLTGYYPGIGPTGYLVGDDRCIACHTATFDDPKHPNKTWDCVGCHTPHRFATEQLGRN